MSGATAGITAIAAGAASALGAGVSAYSQNQATRKQDRIAAEGIRNQQQLQNQANTVVQKTVKDNATDEQANLQKNQASQQSAYLDALRRAAPVQDKTQTATPGASSRYAQEVVDATAGNKAFGQNQAATLARTDAPQLTQLQTQLGLGDAATKLGMINDTSNNQARLSSLREQAIQANPWITAAGQFISGAGAGMSKGATKSASPYTFGSGGGGQGVYADSGLTSAGSLA